MRALLLGTAALRFSHDLMALAGLARFNNDGRFMFPTQHAHTKTLRTARWKQGSGAEQTKVRTSNKNHRRAPARLRCVAS